MAKWTAKLAPNASGTVDPLARYFRALRASPATVKIAIGPGDSTSDATAAAGALHTRLKTFHIQPGEGLEGVPAANIRNHGVNGISIEAWLNDPARLAALVADSPDVCVYSLGINSIRTNDTITAADLTALHRKVIDKVRFALPGVPIIARVPNSLLTTDVGGHGYVTGNPQAKSVALHQSYLALIDAYPDVLVWDAQERVFGTTARATSALMDDQIHPSSVISTQNPGGFQLIADYLVADLLGRKIPLAAGLATSARFNTGFWTAHTAYPRAVEDLDFNTLVASGEFVAGAASYVDFSWPGQAASAIQPYDVLQYPSANGLVDFVLPDSGQYIAQGNNTRLTNFTLPVAPVAGTVRVWRRKYGDVNLQGARLTGRQFKKTGIVGGAGNGYVDIDAYGYDQSPASTWAATTADTLYIGGYGSNPLPLSGAGFSVQGTRKRIYGLSGDFTSYIGQQAVIVGDHA